MGKGKGGRSLRRSWKASIKSGKWGSQVKDELMNAEYALANTEGLTADSRNQENKKERVKGKIDSI